MAINITSFPLGGINFQSGFGVPNHLSTKGSIYIDLFTAIEYSNKDGFNTWLPNFDTNLGSDFFLALSGGTVNGDTNFTNGLSANTISATTINSGATINGLGFTPENLTNKVSSFSGTGSTTRFPTTSAVVNYVTGNTSPSDIILVKNFTNVMSMGAFTTNNWYSFQYGNGQNFLTANLDSGTSYGTGLNPSGIPSIVIPSLNYVVGKKMSKISWHTDYCDQVEAYVSIFKYDLISGTLVNGRQILNENLRILASGINTQDAFAYSKNKIEWNTTDSIDTSISAQCSVYFLFYKHISYAGGGSGLTNIYFNFI